MKRKIWLSGLVGAIGLVLIFSAVKTAFSGQSKAMKSAGISTTGAIAGTGTFSGSYEVSVTKNGFSGGEAQKITVTAGGNATADFTLKEGTFRPNQQMRIGLLKDEPLLSYDELYPPSHARETIERTCILCHGPDFLPNKQWDESQWNAAIDLMQIG